MRRIVKFCALGTPYGKSGHPDFIMWMTDIRLKCGRLWLLSLHLSESSFRKKRRCFKLMTTLTLPLHRFKNFTIAPFYENVRESKNTILELNWVVLSFVQVRLRQPTLLSMHEHNNFLPDRQGKKESHHELHGKHRRYVAGIRQIDTRSGRGCEKKIESHSKPFQTILSAVFGAFSVSCFLLGHQIAKMDKQPAEKHLEAIFALRRARLLRFCQKEKNLSHPFSPPTFLNHIHDLPGDIFVSILDEKYMVKLSRWLDILCSQEGWLNQSR